MNLEQLEKRVAALESKIQEQEEFKAELISQISTRENSIKISADIIHLSETSK